MCLCDLSAWARGVVTAGAWSLLGVFVLVVAHSFFSLPFFLPFAFCFLLLFCEELLGLVGVCGPGVGRSCSGRVGGGARWRACGGDPVVVVVML